MKHSAVYRYLLLLLLSFSISGTMFFYSSSTAYASSLSFELAASKSATSVTDYSYVRFPTQNSNSYDFTPYLDSGVVQDDFYYELDLTVLSEYTFNKRLYYFCPVLYMVAGDNLYLVDDARPEYNSSALKFFSSNDVSFIIKGSDLSSVSFRFVSDAVTKATETHSVTNAINIPSIHLSLAAVDGAAYENAYNRGFSDGENAGFIAGKDAGYSHGYSDGYDDGYEEGLNDSSGSGSGTVPGNPPSDCDLTDAYNQGYAAGQSVGYNEGYSVGYDEGLSVGYENGYAAGFNAAKSSAGSGADKVGTSPKLDLYIFNHKLGQGVAGPLVDTHFINDWYMDTSQMAYGHATLSPFYTIRGLDYYSDTGLQGSIDCYLHMYIDKIHTDSVTELFTSFAIPDLYDLDVFSPNGDRLSFDVDYIVENRTDEYKVIINLKIHLNDLYSGGNILIRPYMNITAIGDYLNPVSVEYCGAVTSSTVKYYVAPDDIDDVVNGFDTDQGNQVNDDLSNSLDSYHDQEHSIFTSVKSGLDDFEFYNFENSPALIAGITFVSSIMTSWFNASGGLGGVGILLSVLFSIMIASMALGLYRYYQSRGKGGKGK